MFPRVLLVQTLIVICDLLCPCTFASANRLERKNISNSEALCNDFSQAVYYLSLNTSSSEWIIFFEGGGGCSSLQECNERWKDGLSPQGINPLMSSIGLPMEVEGSDLLSRVPSENPLFHTFNHILVPYCTKDAFLANRDNPSVNLSDPNFTFQFNDTEGADNFIYKGRVIFESVIEELIEKGMTNASKVILAGSSAGGIGVLNNLPWVEEVLKTGNDTIGSGATDDTELMAIVDSSWFVRFNENHVVSWTSEIVSAFGLPDTCSDFTFGFACCTSPACLFGRGLIELQEDVPIFVVSSTYDIFTLEESLQELLGDNSVNDLDFLRIFNSYGSVMNESLSQSSNAYDLLTVFAPSCTQHVYFATSDLWDEGGHLADTQLSEVNEPPFYLTNPVRDGTWNNVRIEAHSFPQGRTVTLLEALTNWTNNPYFSEFYSDRCVGPVCGQFCTSQIELRPEVRLWHEAVNVLILVVSALMTVIPVMIKLGLYLNMKYILFRQRLYAYKLKHSPQTFPIATVPINVSCVDLNYRIDMVNTGKGSNSESNRNQTTLHSDAPPECSEDQYSIYAGVDTFAPCCKKLFSNCISHYNPPVQDETERQTARLTMVRTDSGISSSINRMRSATPNSIDTMSLDSLDILDNDSNYTLVDVDPEGAGHAPQTNGCLRSKSSLRREKRSIRKKTILHHVSMYVNPGELVAIMGPSGSGKTTLLDVLLGRRRAGYTEGEIFINGTPLQKMREWFIVNTGYVRQLAKSYYNELTVRENLIFSMNMQAPAGMKLSQKLERVEQVIQETGLVEQADIKVGDGIGLGLSGGQRKRLDIAVQLLGMPNIIFLDEPTSGLDSASSLDILKSLQVMAGTGRAIVVTIHQPRSEIFHAFDKILLLCKGQIAFFGSPIKVWEFFREALISEKQLDEAEGQVQDAVLDLLKEKRSQKQVLQAYRESNEPKYVQQAVLESRAVETTDFPQHTESRNPGIWNRLVSLESRASLRQTVFTIVYLPIVYTVFGLVLGTTYIFTDLPVQVLSVTCLLSCSSSLFMSSIIASLLVEPLKLFHLEHSDGISKSHELILQVFIRMSALCTLPLSICATLVFGLVYQNYQFNVYLVLLLAFLLVNQVWISIFIVLTVLAPSQAHRLCPIFAAIGGFCCGFIIPKPEMPVYYSWLFYVNPSFYAFSATSVVVLTDNDLDCPRNSTLECFRGSGIAILSEFGLDNVNPMENLLVLMVMVGLLVLLGIVVLQLKVDFGLIKENLFNTFCSITKRQRRKRVSSMFQDTVDHPTAVLTNVNTNRRDTINSQKPPSKKEVSFRNRKELGSLGDKLEEDKREMLKKLSRTKPSSQFLDCGYHYVMHDFPWKRAEMMADLDTTDGGDLTAANTLLFSPLSRRSRIISDGSEDVFEPETLVTEVTINMDEDGTEKQRRIQANLKWNLRRQKIENEFLRLRHLSINKHRATGRGIGRFRHSVSFGDDLEIQLETSGMRELEKTSEEIRASRESLDNELDRALEKKQSVGSIKGLKNPNKPFLRSMSVPSKNLEERLDRSCPPKLDTHEEFMEELEEEEEDVESPEEEEEAGVGMLGLPPKDIPNFSMEQLDWMETDNDEVD